MPLGPEVKKKNKRVLITSAGTATALNVLSSLRASEFYNVTTVAIDQSADAVGLYLADSYRIVPGVEDPGYIEAVLQVAQSEGVEFIFPIHSTEIAKFSENRGMFHSRGLEMAVASPAAVRLCNEKNLFDSFLATNRFDHPRSFASPAEVDKYPVFVKPRSGSSSVNSFKADCYEDLAFYWRKYPMSLIQEFIPWREVTVDCYVSRSQVMIGCVPRYRVKVKDGKSVVSETLEDSNMVASVELLLRKLGLVGPCNVQLFFDGANSMKFIEINPRLAAGGLPLATKAGVNIPELMLRDIDDCLPTTRVSAKGGMRMLRYLCEIYINA